MKSSSSSSSSSSYDDIPKLLITTHGQWKVPTNYKKNGPPTFKLPYNTRIMYATGIGVVNYLEQTVPNMINNELKKKQTKKVKLGLKKLKLLKKDLKSYDLYGCCDDLSCKDNRRNNAPIQRDVQEQEQNSSNSSGDRGDATEFLDHTDKPYRITSKEKGNIMPIKTFSISDDDFGKYEDGTNVRNIKNFNDNRMILYIPGHKPIDVLYNWDKQNKNEPFITVKLNYNRIEITLKTVLERVQKIYDNLGLGLLTDLDLIDLSCNVTQDDNNTKAPKDDGHRAKYINELKTLIFDNDEVLSSSPSPSSSSSPSPSPSPSSSSSPYYKMEEENGGFFSMILKSLNNHRNKNRTTSKQIQVNKKKQKSTKKSRRDYIRKKTIN
jgi:hypothetical protein